LPVYLPFYVISYARLILDNSDTQRTSQVPIEQGHDDFASTTIGDAIVDWCLHSAHRLNLKGESLRKAKTQKTESFDPS